MSIKNLRDIARFTFTIEADEYGAQLTVFADGELFRWYPKTEPLRTLSNVAALLDSLDRATCPRCHDKPAPQTQDQSVGPPSI